MFAQLNSKIRSHFIRYLTTCLVLSSGLAAPEVVGQTARPIISYSPIDLSGLGIPELRERIEYYKYHNNDTALWYSLELQQRNLKVNNLSDKLANIAAISRVYIHLEYFDLALVLFYDILPLVQAETEPKAYAEVQHQLGTLQSFLNHYEKAISHYLTSLSYRDSIDFLGKANTFHALGDDYRFLNKYDSSYYYLEKAYRIVHLLPHKELQGQITLAFAETLLKLDSTQHALQLIHDIEEKLRSDESSNLVKGYISMLKGIYHGQIKNYPLAIQYFEEALLMAQKMNYNYGQLTIYKEFIPILEASGDLKLAYLHNSLYHNILLSSYQSGMEKYIFQMEIIQKTREKDAEIKLQQMSLGKNRIIIVTLLIVLVLFVVIMLLLLKSYRANQRLVSHLNVKNERIELLMRELHHRVKNNLQIISSLLGLQSLRTDDPQVKKAIEEGKIRVRAMAIIHQKLYRKAEIMGVDTAEYLNDLVDELKKTYSPNQEVNITLEAPSENMDIDTMLPLGLLVNEVLSNAFKYAFHTTHQPKLYLSLQVLENKQRYQLIVQDNGPGFADDFDPKNSDSFGMKLIHLLAHQLNGSLLISSDQGVNVSFEFPYSKP